MATRHSAGLWLLIITGGVTLILLATTAVIILRQISEQLPGWNHLLMLAIFALLLGVVVRAVVNVTSPE